jgi:hypothetical protein
MLLTVAHSHLAARLLKRRVSFLALWRVTVELLVVQHDVGVLEIANLTLKNRLMLFAVYTFALRYRKLSYQTGEQA